MGITKEMVEETALNQYPVTPVKIANNYTIDTGVLGRKAFVAGANWTVQQMNNDATQLLTWITENGWYTSPPMWCNGEQSSDCDGGKGNYVEITSQELYQLYLNSKNI
jgi:hypothetical protein